VTRRAARLFTDGRYKAQAAEEVQAAQVEIVSARLRSPRCSGWPRNRASSLPASIPQDHGGQLARWKAALPARLRRGPFSALPAPLVEPLRW
jgi:hypothetical protein